MQWHIRSIPVKFWWNAALWEIHIQERPTEVFESPDIRILDISFNLTAIIMTFFWHQQLVTDRMGLFFIFQETQFFELMVFSFSLSLSIALFFCRETGIKRTESERIEISQLTEVKIYGLQYGSVEMICLAWEIIS